MNKKLSEKLIDQVNSGQVKMKPKTYFVLKTSLFFLITFFIFLSILFFLSFIIFSLRTSGVSLLPGLGFRGIGVFLISLPWILILTAVVLILVLELFVKKFSFSYRRPILYSVLVIVVFVVLGGFAIANTQMHSGLFLKAQQEKLPIAGGFYRGFSDKEHSQVHKGTVSEIIDDGFSLKTFDGEVLTIIINSKTKLPLNGILNINDQVLILGKRLEDKVDALGIRMIHCQNCQTGNLRNMINKPMYHNKMK